MTQTNHQPNPSASPPAAANNENLSPDTQALLHLHKMSMTAGLGSGDYVAVNLLAVVSMLFGLASLVTLMGDSLVLLLFPLVGVILALLALRQIRHSNGTQTGGLVAWTGLALCVLIGGGKSASDTVWYIQTGKDRAQINQLIARLSDDLRSSNYDDAYTLFDRKFHERINQKDFLAHLNAIESNPQVPSIDNLKISSTLVEIDHVTQRRKATASLIPHFKGWAGMTDDRLDASFVDTESSGWKIDGIPAFFTSRNRSAAGGPPDANAPAGPGGGPGGN